MNASAIKKSKCKGCLSGLLGFSEQCHVGFISFPVVPGRNNQTDLQLYGHAIVTLPLTCQFGQNSASQLE
jgi:hypothetical protein